MVFTSPAAFWFLFAFRFYFASAYSGWRAAREASISFAHRHCVFMCQQIFGSREGAHIVRQTLEALAANGLQATPIPPPPRAVDNPPRRFAQPPVGKMWLLPLA